MRIVRFAVDEDVSYGVVGADRDAGGDVIAELAGHPFGHGKDRLRLSGMTYRLDDVRLLAPVLPSKVVAVGKNYAGHVKEMGGGPPPEDPVLFLKPSTAVCGPGDPVRYPAGTERVDHEGELAVVIGRLCRNVPASDAGAVIFGYTCANDVTARDLQAKDGQWTRAKGFDTFCPIGPWIETDVSPADLELITEVNGEIRQQARTSQLLHGVATLVAHATSVMTLLPGDVLLTGTPEGVGPVKDGDEMSVTIEGIGTLKNRVVAGD